MQDARSLNYLLRVARSWTRDFGTLESRCVELQRMPIDLIWGENDVVVPLATAEKLQRALPHATLQVIPDCGHLPYEERPAEFLACVRKALGHG
jgi:pimeloyl-ACP methyl ester carboxylesterase